jgi:prolyl oligopeptidase
MDLTWGTLAVSDSWGTMLTALPWLAALTVAVLLLWLLAAALVFRECRRLAEPRIPPDRGRGARTMASRLAGAGRCGEASQTGTGGAPGFARKPVLQDNPAMRCLSAFAVFGVFTGLLSAQAPPPTRIGPVTDILHGTAIVDPYRWLEDQNSSETRAWIETQNRYTQAYFARIPGRDKLHQTIEALVRYDFYEIPSARAGRYFFSRTRKHENRNSICMRNSLSGQDEIVVNPADIDPDASTTVSFLSLPPDASFLPFRIRRGGADEFEVRILDLKTRAQLPDRLPPARYNGVYVKPDRSGIFYARYDPVKGGGIYYRAMGSNLAADPQIFGQGYTPKQIISMMASGDDRYLIARVATGVPPSKVEVWYREIAGDAPFRPIVQDVESEFDAFYGGGHVYLRTNWKAPNRRILEVDLKNPARERWREIVPETESPIESISLLGGRLFVEYLENVKTRIKQFDVTGKFLGDFKLPAVGSVFGLSGRWDRDEAFYSYTSFTEPAAVYRASVASGRSELWYRPPIPVRDGEIEVEQVWYESKDKTRVPMFLVHKKGLARDGDRPVVLTGYGGFKVSETAGFNPAAGIWSQYDGVFALPNLRGGGEFGEKWHQAGMFEKKQNVFDDFIAAAEWLVANHYTKPARITIMGASNGGLLMGAALTQRPDLFGAVLCGLPLLDMLRYQKFKVGSFWTTEYGSADDPAQFPYLFKYSPYHHVDKGAKYPAVLFTTGDADTRVDPLHARKMTALVQASTASGKPVLLDYDTKAGHSGGIPLDKAIDDWTNWGAFALAQTGVLAVK